MHRALSVKQWCMLHIILLCSQIIVHSSMPCYSLHGPWIGGKEEMESLGEGLLISTASVCLEMWRLGSPVVPTPNHEVHCKRICYHPEGMLAHFHLPA